MLGSCVAVALLLLLGMAGAAAPQREPDGAVKELSLVDRWNNRLEALRPERPEDYFTLAEEVADAAAGHGGPDAVAARALARQLFGLSAALAAPAGPLRPDDAAQAWDPTLVRSAALALAELAEDSARAARLRTAALLLDRRGGTLLGPGGAERATVEASAALALSEALSMHRRGLGARLSRQLGQPGVMELVEAYDFMIDGGPNRLREDARAYRGQTRPGLKEPAVTSMLQLEIGLLAGAARPWSADLAITADRPLAEVDPSRLDDLLEVDRSRPLWRGGRWVSR